MKSMNLFNHKGEFSKASFRDNKSKDTTSVEDTFIGCESLTQPDPSRSKVKDMIDADMKDMFVGCESLTQPDPSRSKVKDMIDADMKDMFVGCESLAQPNPSRSKAEDMTGIEDIFSDCKSLT